MLHNSILDSQQEHTLQKKRFAKFNPAIPCRKSLDVFKRAASVEPLHHSTEWWGAGVVICLEQGADLHMAQLMPLLLTVSCFSKIQIGLTFLVPAHPGSPGKRAVKRVCVCVFKRSSKTLFIQCFMRVCCWVPVAVADIHRQLWAPCCRHQCSAANVGSFMLRANGGDSIQT